MKVKVKYTFDEHDCETCGSSWADGADIYFDDELVYQFVPIAHCYNGQSMDRDDVLKIVLEHLGHEFEELT